MEFGEMGQTHPDIELVPRCVVFLLRSGLVLRLWVSILDLPGT